MNLFASRGAPGSFRVKGGIMPNVFSLG
jgi:hypothetical protein